MSNFFQNFWENHPTVSLVILGILIATIGGLCADFGLLNTGRVLLAGGIICGLCGVFGYE